MNLETKLNLDDETLSRLQDLIRVNIDSANGFARAAEDVEDDNLKKVFQTLQVERGSFATELQSYVNLNGEDPTDSGSFAAAFHRSWMDFRSAISGGDAGVILSIAEEGEDQIKVMYEKVLTETAGSAMNDVLQAQYARIKAGHDRVRDLRDTVLAQNS